MMKAAPVILATLTVVPTVILVQANPPMAPIPNFPLGGRSSYLSFNGCNASLMLSTVSSMVEDAIAMDVRF